MTASTRTRRTSRAAEAPTGVVSDLIAGKYRLERFLGAGGVGEVWQAHNVVLEVPVAVKLLHVHGRGDAKLAERMAREARATARLNHPAIVKVFDFGTTSAGDPFLVMELLHGETLAALLDRECRLAAFTAVQTVLPIAEALALAHARDIVHRDIKPENVFLTGSGARVQPKLLDFGIARVENRDRKLTLDGALIGTPEYMSPEQARGADADYRTDIWSLCALLYELVSGVQPFTGDNMNAVLDAVCQKEPESFAHHAAGDEELWEIVRCGLIKDRAERWQSMRELGGALARWLAARGVSEDACGSSLKTTWLCDPDSSARLGRISMPPPVIESIPAAQETVSARRRTLSPGLMATSAAAITIAVVLIASGGGSEADASPIEPSRALLADASVHRSVARRAPEPPTQPPPAADEREHKKPKPSSKKPLPSAQPKPRYDFGF